MQILFIFQILRTWTTRETQPHFQVLEWEIFSSLEVFVATVYFTGWNTLLEICISWFLMVPLCNVFFGEKCIHLIISFSRASTAILASCGPPAFLHHLQFMWFPLRTWLTLLVKVWKPIYSNWSSQLYTLLTQFWNFSLKKKKNKAWNPLWLLR